MSYTSWVALLALTYEVALHPEDRPVVMLWWLLLFVLGTFRAEGAV